MIVEMRCPECGSQDVECNGQYGPTHNHTCVACGYQVWPSVNDLNRARANHPSRPYTRRPKGDRIGGPDRSPP